MELLLLLVLLDDRLWWWFLQRARLTVGLREKSVLIRCFLLGADERIRQSVSLVARMSKRLRMRDTVQARARTGSGGPLLHAQLGEGDELQWLNHLAFLG